MSNLTFHDETNDSLVVGTHYSIDRINKTMDYCKEMHNSGNHSVLGGDKLIASVDPAIIHLWCNTNKITMSDFMLDPKIAKRFLEDPDNSNFRIWKGAL